MKNLQKFNVSNSEEESNKNIVLGEIKEGFGNVIQIELYEGDYNGVYQKLDIAITNKGNVFQTEGLSYLPSENGQMIPQLDLNKWKNIEYTTLNRIIDEMKFVSTEKFISR